MKRVVIGLVVAVVVLALAGGAFFGGMKLGQNQVIKNPMQYLAGADGAFPIRAGNGQFPGGAGTDAQGGQFPGAGGTPGAGFQGRGVAASADTIQAIDGDTITLNTADGSVKVITSDTTYIQKYMSVTVADLAVGDSVTVQGTNNDDGSITARSIRVMTGLGFQGDLGTPTPAP
jgi:hypothetical protein